MKWKYERERENMSKEEYVDIIIKQISLFLNLIRPESKNRHWNEFSTCFMNQKQRTKMQHTVKRPYSGHPL